MTAARGVARLLAGVGVALLGAVAPAVTAAAATPGVPYTDPDAVGYIGLCNQAGQQITSGSVDTTPFVWRAVSSVPAPAGYNGPTRTATLTAYLPLQELPAGDWSGEELTSASLYSDPSDPMAAATAKDVPLEVFLQDYPPAWDGFIQLRMFLGSEGKEIYSLRYPSLDIQVTGTTWRAVGGGPVNCSSGTSVSYETILTPSTTATGGKGGGTTTNPGPVGPIGSGATGSGRSGGSGAAGSGSSGRHGSGPGSDGAGSGTEPGTGATAPSTTATSTTGQVPLIVGLVIAALAVATALALLLTRRRRDADPTPPEPTTTS